MAGRTLIRAIVTLVLAAMAAVVTQLLTAGAASADPSAGDWSKLRQCESSGRYTINTGNGYYGAYQFDLPTWRSVGGTNMPHLVPPGEQDFRALYLYRMRGWQPWECAGKLHLRGDADARSKHKPSYADSAYIGGKPGKPAAMPKWPGLVYAYGDCAPALRTFQLRMNAYGYDFQGTGCYYNETRAAVLDLQRANGIKASGRLGPKTWKAAWKGKAPR